MAIPCGLLFSIIASRLDQLLQVEFISLSHIFSWPKNAKLGLTHCRRCLSDWKAVSKDISSCCMRNARQSVAERLIPCWQWTRVAPCGMFSFNKLHPCWKCCFKSCPELSAASMKWYCTFGNFADSGSGLHWIEMILLIPAEWINSASSASASPPMNTRNFSWILVGVVLPGELPNEGGNEASCFVLIFSLGNLVGLCRRLTPSWTQFILLKEELWRCYCAIFM